MSPPSRRPGLTALLAVTLILTAIGCVRPRPPWPTDGDGRAVLPVGPLRPDGRWIKDATGRTVIVHGLQVARKTPPYLPPSSSFTDRDAAALERWGFNAVRLGWFWKGLEPERGRIDRHYVAELDRIGDLLAERNVFTLLEAHQDGYNERLGGAGFPDWATVGQVPPNANGLLGEPSWEAFEHLYANGDGVADSFAAAWRVLAAAFADNPRMLGYDLINEPGAGTSSPSCLSFDRGCPEFDQGTLRPFQDRVAAAIRDVDDTTIAFYEPNIFHDVGAPSRLGAPPTASGPSAFAFHAYCLNRFLNPATDRESEAPGYEECGRYDGATFDHAVATSEAMGIPPLFGEFGDTQDLTDVARMIDLADEHLMGWIYWGYKDWDDDPGGQGSGGLFDDADHDGTLRSEKLAVLSRPYAMATAGTPLSSRYDRDRRVFEYEFAPDHSLTAPTVLFTSPINNPRGYRAVVDGARVVSRPGATYLQLRPDRGATRVSVRLIGRPGGVAGDRAESLTAGPTSVTDAVDPVALDADPVVAACGRNVGDPDRIDLDPIAASRGHRVGRLDVGAGRGSLTGPDAVSVTYGPGDVAWFDLGHRAGPLTVDLLCRAGGTHAVTVGVAPTVPASFTGRSTHNVNVATANSRLAFDVPRRGRYVADVRLAGGSIRLGLRRGDGSMPTAPRLTESATVDLGPLRPGAASLDVVALPGPSTTWTVTVRQVR